MNDLISIGNFALESIYQSQKKVLADFYGGMNFRFLIALGYFGQKADYIAAIGREKKWQKTLALFSKMGFKNLSDSRKSQSIKFIWHFDENNQFKAIDFLYPELMDLIVENCLKIDLSSYHWLNLCSLELKNESKIVNRLRSDQVLSYIFYQSNLKTASAAQYLDFFRRVDYLFINEEEATQLTGISGLDGGKYLASLAKQVILTRAEKGAAFFQAGQLVANIPAVAVPLINDAGAGDTLAGATMAGIINGLSFETAVRQGVLLASWSTLDYLNKNIYQQLSQQHQIKDE